MSPADLRLNLLEFVRNVYPDMQISVAPWTEDPARLAISFVDPNFGALYPAQRYHYLAHLIPQDFWDQYLSDTIWFELAPGETPDDLEYPDDELIASITPDVMRLLVRSRAIETLDDLLCPPSPETPPVRCHGDYRHARQALLARGFTEAELFDVLHVLMARGGFCDCEILYNAVEESRLKAEYWTARAQNREPYDPHGAA